MNTSWVVFYFLSRYQDWLYHLEQAKDCVDMSFDDWFMVESEEGETYGCFGHVCAYPSTYI